MNEDLSLHYQSLLTNTGELDIGPLLPQAVNKHQSYKAISWLTFVEYPRSSGIF